MTDPYLTNDPLDTLEALTAIYRRLRTATDPAAMLATAADLTGAASPFEVCLVLTVEDGALTTRGSRPLADAASEQLRRRVLTHPVPLAPETREAELLRRPIALDAARTQALPSAVSAALGIEHVAVAPVAPDVRAVALLVAGRADRHVTPGDVRVLGAYASAIAAALDLVIMRARAADVLAETRRAATSIQALAREMFAPSVALPVDHGLGPAFPEPAPEAAVATGPYADRLTTSESRIAELLAVGRSNREIAETLVLSTETVKSHVSSILRKLGVTNRAEAAARLTRREG